MKKLFFCIILGISLRPFAASTEQSLGLPPGFVRLSEVAPQILQDIRYAGIHNFLGRPARGYLSAECWLTLPAAQALLRVEKEARTHGYTLKVYDCYRPQRAVDDFVIWTQNLKELSMKGEFYPKEEKANILKDGYIAAKSGHSRGSTMDLTLVKLPVKPQEVFHAHQPLVSCTAPYLKRFHDNSIDMGTGFDCFDAKAHGDSQNISYEGQVHRKLLQTLMEQQGFKGIPEEWWHFTLKNEVNVSTYYDFPIAKDCPASFTESLKDSRQVLLAVTSDWSSVSAELNLYERTSTSSPWQKVKGPWPGVVGHNGMAWSPALAEEIKTSEIQKHEGDGKSPAGLFHLGSEFGFASSSASGNKNYIPLNENSFCVDDLKSTHYNQVIDISLVKKDWNSGEQMREVPGYKTGFVVDYPAQVKDRGGSCIFLHIWKSSDHGTAGCVAMAEDQLTSFAARVRPELKTLILISPKDKLAEWGACLPLSTEILDNL